MWYSSIELAMFRNFVIVDSAADNAFYTERFLLENEVMTNKRYVPL